ncbi:uncharacterized protein LOC110028490 isoform X2 [Phalaenopsis equestris]|uniref:uncharacterized protein LOC110028490 isoform X2 n=1 Tax=Phalaenopsis equestris TaxID=78828 RepID=UPI0009E5B4C3|nr:uncharacterized protein LOC110028490 isoform X2 [Phalaenopsis equestris]
MKGILTWIKRWPFRSASRTPYDRPPTAAHGLRDTKSVNESDTDGRLSKFVESVSSLITMIASKFFSSVCRSREKNFVKLDAPTVNSVEQRLVEANNLSTSKDIGISDIEKQIIQRRNERAKVIHLLKMIKSQSSKIHNSGVPKKVLKRDHTFLDDDETLLCRPHKIHKKLGEKEKQFVDNIPFTTNDMEGAIATNGRNDACTSCKSSSPIIKSTNTTTSCHVTLPLQRNSVVEDEMIVKNVPITTTISENVITTIDMNDVSSLSSTNTSISSHVALPSQRKSSFLMSAPEFLDLDEENDETNIYAQLFFDLDQPKLNLLEQKSSNIHKYEVENKPNKFIDQDEEIDQDEMVVENAPFTTTISENVIATNDMNDASSLSISRRSFISSTNATISSFVTLPSTPEFHDLDEENDETNTNAQSFMDLDQPKTNLLEQQSSEVENKQKKALKRDSSFLDDEESLLCPPLKIHKKLGEKKKQVVDNISFTTAPMEGAIATNDINDAFTSSRSSLPIIESTNASASCHATVPSQRKRSFYMSTPEFLDIDEENDETNIYVQSSMDLDQPK